MLPDLILTPTGCTDAQAAAAARTVADQAHRLGASSEDTMDVLAALGLVKPLAPVSVGVRDSFGRLRASEPPRSRPVSMPRPDRVAGETLCRYPGRKHLLTAVTSESTFVDSRGQRQCKVGIERRRQAEGLPDLNRCKAGLHPKDGPGYCRECKNQGARDRRASASAEGRVVA